MDLVIVESPAKAKTISKYLGGNYEVTASFGHIRDLPSKNGSVDPEANFKMTWGLTPGSQKIVSKIVAAAKDAKNIILATDPDREGEAISWHIAQLLQEKKLLKTRNLQRVVFNAITRKSVLNAMATPRAINDNLVYAYLARRALDYLVGFYLSPVLWRKLPGARSAGRVQSVALRLICDREDEIYKFTIKEYWSLTVFLLTKDSKELIEANLIKVEETKLERTSIGDEKTAREYQSQLKASNFEVIEVTKKQIKNNPAPPYITSTLQQDASNKLGFSAQETMSLAQKLYEGNFNLPNHNGGLITYMRTDGVQIAPEAIENARKTIFNKFGKDYLPAKANIYKTKARNAQEAHEAIRPVSFDMTPEKLTNLSIPLQKLYKLIWNRAIASQMLPAINNRTIIKILATSNKGKMILSSTFMEQIFPGYLKVYENSLSLTKSQAPIKARIEESSSLHLQDVDCKQHFTQPPARYTDASLIKQLESLSIGRPSTYASIISTLLNRDYVKGESKKLIPQPKGQIVSAFLKGFFTRYVEFDFTANLEEELDLISDGKSNWNDVIKTFWSPFKKDVDSTIERKNSDILDILNEALSPLLFPKDEDGNVDRSCPKCKKGELSLKTSHKGGPFIGCSLYPECIFTKQIGPDSQININNTDRILGKDPATDEDIWLKFGRFGAYVQLGEAVKASKSVPKRSSLGNIFDPDTITLKNALTLLSLPREIGINPDTNEPILSSFGRYGPYIKSGTVYGTLKSPQQVLYITLEEALEILKNKKSKGTSSRSTGKVLGVHPETNQEIQLKSGRFGAYLKYGKLNVSIPASLPSPEELEMDILVELIAAKEAKQSSKKKVSTKKESATSKKKVSTKKKSATSKKKVSTKKESAASKKKVST